MIRRGFWMTVGAVTGIMAYRRVCAAGRRMSARLSGGGAAGLAGQSIRFVRDVREGMELYTRTHSAAAGSTLRARDLGPGRGHRTDHDPQPKDGR